MRQSPLFSTTLLKHSVLKISYIYKTNARFLLIKLITRFQNFSATQTYAHSFHISIAQDFQESHNIFSVFINIKRIA